MAKGEIPVGVKILSILGYIGAVLMLILGLGLIFGSAAMATVLAQIPALAAIGAGLFVGVGIVVILLAVLEFFIARGLWKGQNWARIITLVFSALGIISSLLSIMAAPGSSITNIVIYGVIVWYLGFKDNVKAFFK